jgi:hypothetical protein
VDGGISSSDSGTSDDEDYYEEDVDIDIKIKIKTNNKSKSMNHSSSTGSLRNTQRTLMNAANNKSSVMAAASKLLDSLGTTANENNGIIGSSTNHTTSKSLDNDEEQKHTKPTSKHMRSRSENDMMQIMPGTQGNTEMTSTSEMAPEMIPERLPQSISIATLPSKCCVHGDYLLHCTNQPLTPCSPFSCARYK